MMYRLTAFLLVFIFSTAHAQVETWRGGLLGPIDRLTSFLGAESKCLSASREEYEYVDCEIQKYEYENAQLRTDFDHMTEELIFLEGARRTHQLTVCQGKLHKKYSQDQETRRVLLQNSLTQFRPIQEKLGELGRRRDEARDRVKLYSEHHPDDRFNPRLTDWRLERLKPAQEDYSKAQGEIEALMSRIPMGNRPEMQEMFVNLAKSQASVTDNQFYESFDQVMGKLQRDVATSAAFFDRIIRPKGDGSFIYSVNNDLKTALVKTGQIENVVTSLGMEERLADRFICRSKARYIKGPATLSLIEVPFYFAGVYGLGRLALRASVAGLRAGTSSARIIAETTRTTAKLGMMGLSGVEFVRGGTDALNSCFPPEFLHGDLDDQCTEESEILGLYQEASIGQCVTSSALALAPPALVGVRGLASIVRPTGIPLMSRTLASSGRFRFFQSGRREARFSDQTLQPGVSYTVVFDGEGKMVLGSNFRNPEGGFSGTHVALLRATGRDFPHGRPMRYEGGTIRVNQDGSIDISGYRLQRSSERSQQMIEEALREALPGATIRSTPGKLSELPTP